MNDEYTDELEPVTVKLPSDQLERINSMADYHGVSRSAVMRNIVFNGIRAHKYMEEFDLDPEHYEIDQ